MIVYLLIVALFAAGAETPTVTTTRFPDAETCALAGVLVVGEHEDGSTTKAECVRAIDS